MAQLGDFDARCMARYTAMDNEISEYKELLANHPSVISNDNALIKVVTDESQIREWMAQYKTRLRAEGKPDDWGTIGVVLNDPYIVVLRDLVEFPGGARRSYFRVINQADLRGGQGAAVLAEKDNSYLLLHLFRHPTRAWSYEIPRGFGEPGVEAKQQARNEIREEVRGEVAEIIDLGDYHSNTGLEANRVRLFYARLKSVGTPDAQEGIDSLLWVSLAQLEEFISSAKITDGFTIAAYTRAKLMGLLV